MLSQGSYPVSSTQLAWPPPSCTHCAYMEVSCFALSPFSAAYSRGPQIRFVWTQFCSKIKVLHLGMAFVLAENRHDAGCHLVRDRESVRRRQTGSGGRPTLEVTTNPQVASPVTRGEPWSLKDPASSCLLTPHLYPGLNAEPSIWKCQYSGSAAW